jgi:hypothetical protein
VNHEQDPRIFIKTIGAKNSPYGVMNEKEKEGNATGENQSWDKGIPKPGQEEEATKRQGRFQMPYRDEFIWHNRKPFLLGVNPKRLPVHIVQVCSHQESTFDIPAQVEHAFFIGEMLRDRRSNCQAWWNVDGDKGCESNKRKHTLISARAK